MISHYCKILLSKQTKNQYSYLFVEELELFTTLVIIRISSGFSSKTISLVQNCGNKEFRVSELVLA